MRSAKQKGSTAERDLVAKFWEQGWSAHRIAGSGSSKYPSPDIIAGNWERKLAIEVKITKATIKYFSEEEIEALLTFARMFGAEPWVAVKFTGVAWHLLPVENLTKTNKQWCIREQDLSFKGQIMEEITQ